MASKKDNVVNPAVDENATVGESDTPESINLADVTKQLEAMQAMLAEAKAEVANAKAEAEKILAEANASANGGLTEEQKAANEKREAYWNELVEVRLFKDNSKYKDDVFVSVGDDNCVIKRGEKVMIKRKFAAELDQSDLQDYETSLLIEQKSQEFAKSDL